MSPGHRVSPSLYVLTRCWPIIALAGLMGGCSRSPRDDRADITSSALRIVSLQFRLAATLDDAFAPTSFSELYDYLVAGNMLHGQNPNYQIDGWGTPYQLTLLHSELETESTRGYEIRSAGWDRSFQTPDDIVAVVEIESQR